MNKVTKRLSMGALAALMLFGGIGALASVPIPNWSQNVNRALHSNGNTRSASLQVNANHHGVNGIQAQIMNLANDARSGWASIPTNHNTITTLNGGRTVQSGTVTATASQVRRGRFQFRVQGDARWHPTPNLDSNQGHN